MSSLEKNKYNLASDLIGCIPTSWLDPLLTGESAVLPDRDEYSPKDIERLLTAIRNRMLEKAGLTTEQTTKAKETR